jgi:hypothetical protein
MYFFLFKLRFEGILFAFTLSSVLVLLRERDARCRSEEGEALFL